MEVRSLPHVSCIGNKTAAQASVQDVGIPPAGHSTPSEQQVEVTRSENVENSGKSLQLVGSSGAAGPTNETRCELDA